MVKKSALLILIICGLVISSVADVGGTKKASALEKSVPGAGTTRRLSEEKEIDKKLLLWNGEKMAPGTEWDIKILEIDTENNKMVVRYEPSQIDPDKRLIRVNIIWGEKGDENTYILGGGNPYWATTLYNTSTLYGRKFLPGQDEVMGEGTLRNNLADNKSYQIFFATTYVDAKGHNARYLYNKIDYSDCMKAHQPGAVCRLKDSKAKYPEYGAFLNGHFLEAEPETSEPESAIKPEEMSPLEGDVALLVEEKPVIKVEMQDEKNKTDEKAQGYSNYYGLGEEQTVLLAGFQKQETEGKSRGGGEQNGGNTASKEGEKKAEKEKTVAEVPRAGKIKQSRLDRLGLISLLVAGIAILLWWLIPAKRKKEEEKDDTI